MRRELLIAGALLALLVASPLIALLLQAAREAGLPVELGGRQLRETVARTLIVTGGCGAVCLLFGVVPAWLIAAYRFPGSRLLGPALALPLAVPAYIAAYAWSGLLGYGGTLSRQLQTLGASPLAVRPLFEALTSPWGLAAVLGSVLFPYVYLISRAAFGLQSASQIEAARLLRCSGPALFWRIALPLAYPAIAAGLTLSLMEAFADWGASYHYGVRTLSVEVFSHWTDVGSGNRASAVRLALVLLAFLVALVAIERRLRRPPDGEQLDQPLRQISLRGWRGWLATLTCAIPLLLGFGLPVGQLLLWASDQGQTLADRRFWALVGSSLTLAAAAAALTVAASAVIVCAGRLHPGRLASASSEIAAYGYATPGALVAFGCLLIAGQLDHAIAWLRDQPGLVVGGSVGLLLAGYVSRFAAVAKSALEGSSARLSGSLEEASRTLGRGPLWTALTVTLPLLTPALVTAGLLVFVDVLKELPLTLLLAPFDVDTLAERAYELAGDEELDRAALPALMIVSIACVPVLLGDRLLRRRR